MRDLLRDPSYCNWAVNLRDATGQLKGVVEFIKLQQLASGAAGVAQSAHSYLTSMTAADRVGFGKYKGQPASAVLLDTQYINFIAEVVEEEGTRNSELKRLYHFIGPQRRLSAKMAVARGGGGCGGGCSFFGCCAESYDDGDGWEEGEGEEEEEGDEEGEEEEEGDEEDEEGEEVEAEEEAKEEAKEEAAPARSSRKRSRVQNA